MISGRPEASRNAVYATSAVVTLIAEPTTADVSLSPSFRSTATTPKHTADRRGSASCPSRKPSRFPPSESSVVPTTITTVPITIGTVMDSPSSAIASAEDNAPPSARRCRVCGIMWRRSSYSEVLMRRVIIPLGIAFIACLAFFGSPRPAAAAPEGTVTWGVHITLASRWLDPAETEGIITPFMFLYALHDALVKPMPAGWNTPSLAESWSQSKDGLTYEFVLRKGVKFHNGDPVTAEDVKFSYERYRGAGVKLLKDRVKEVQIVDPGRIPFVPTEPE